MVERYQPYERAFSIEPSDRVRSLVSSSMPGTEPRDVAAYGGPLSCSPKTIRTRSPRLSRALTACQSLGSLKNVRLDWPARAALASVTLAGSRNSARASPQPAIGRPFLPTPEFFAVASPRM